MKMDRLCELRKNKGLMQADMAAHLKITQVGYSMYESGKRQMSYETLCLLADFFEVSIDYLLGRGTSKPISHDECELIRVYRSLTKDQQEIFIEQGKLFVAQNAKKEKSSTSRTTGSKTG